MGKRAALPDLWPSHQGTKPHLLIRDSQLLSSFPPLIPPATLEEATSRCVKALVPEGA